MTKRNISTGFQKTAPGFYILFGHLTFQTVPCIWQESQIIFNTGEEKITFDLAKISHSDSSSVALLIAWMREANKKKKQLLFLNLPKQMLDIIQLAGLKKLLLGI